MDRNAILLQIKDHEFIGKKTFSFKNSLVDLEGTEIFVKSVQLEKSFSENLKFIYLNQNPLEVPEHKIEVSDAAWNKLNIENTANEGKGLARYIRRVMLGNVTMESIFVPLDASLTYKVDIPQDAYLEYSIALRTSEMADLGNSVFEVVVTNGEKKVSFITYLNQNSETLKQNFKHRIDNLKAFAGEDVDITFRVRGRSNSASADESFVILGAPNLYIRENVTKLKNVVLISLDTLSADNLGCYGYKRDTSPNIDKFAGEATLFLNPIASSCWTLPSHMSMMTGLHPTETGFFLTKTPHNNVRFSKNIKTLAEYIKEKGYRTVAFTGGALVGSLFGYDRGFDIYYQRTSSEDKDAKEEVDRAIKWIRSNDSHFFMFFHTYEVHYPYMRDYYNRKEARNIRTNRDKVIAKYDSGIRYADEQIGRLIEALKEKGIYSNTLLIITSDHGETFRFMAPDAPSGDHGISLYDDEIKVPLIIGGAKEFALGKRIRTQVRSVDIVPTILDYLGIELENEIRGTSMISLLKETDPKERIAFAEATWKAPCESKALRTDKIKYIQNMYEGSGPKFGKEKYELYNLEKDPGEKNRHFEKYGREIEKYKMIMNSMLKSIEKNIEKLELLIQTKQGQDSELLKQLLGLGYLN
jgi:arylsulfatase A-like enzyme